jgi:hypothetical protein
VESILGPLGTTATTGLLYLARVIVKMEKSVEWTVYGRGNRSTRRKPAPTPICPPQIPLARPGANPGSRGGKPATNRFSYGAVSACSIVPQPTTMPRVPEIMKSLDIYLRKYFLIYRDHRILLGKDIWSALDAWMVYWVLLVRIIRNWLLKIR